jgi:hypothetical protein
LFATASQIDPPAIAGLALHNPKTIKAATAKIFRIAVPLVCQISGLHSRSPASQFLEPLLTLRIRRTLLQTKAKQKLKDENG